MEQFPLLDFTAPWVALIQIALYLLLPQLVGLITSKFTDSTIKVVLLGVLTLVGVILTHLLDYAVTDTWAAFDLVELVNIVVNWVVGWFLSHGAYSAILKPTGATAAAQKSNVIQIFGPSNSLKRAA